MKKGFTLIELLVVISIIGLLSSIVLSSLNSARAKSRYAQAIIQMRQIKVAAEFYYNNVGGHPADAGIGSMPSGLSPYITSWPTPSCANHVYDWNNFSSGADVHVDIRTISPSASIGNYCIYSSTGNCAGTNILNITPKQLSC